MTHPDGRSKAEFFTSFGFHLDEWQFLALSLTKHCENNLVVSVVESEWGKRYSVEGESETPDGRTPHVRTVWIVERGDEMPRPVTACPSRRQHV
jgi:hypothetical protein